MAPQVSIGILTVVPEDSLMSPQGLPLEVTDTAIILEGVIAMDGLENVPHAMCLVFGLIYALNMEYPSQLKNTFEFIQRVFLSLGHKSLQTKTAITKKNLLF